MNRYRKSITALVTGVLSWVGVVIASTPNEVTSAEWLGLGLALAVAAGVYQIPNNPS